MTVLTIGAARCSCRASRNINLGRVFGASPYRVISRSDRGDLITALVRTRSPGKCRRSSARDRIFAPRLTHDSGLQNRRLYLLPCADRQRYASGAELAHTRSKLSR